MSGAIDRRCFVCKIYVGTFTDAEWRDQEHACHDCQMALDDAAHDAVVLAGKVAKAMPWNAFGKDAINV